MNTKINHFPKTLIGFYKQNFFRYYGKMQILWSVIFVIASSGGSIFQPLYMKKFTEFLEQFSISGTSFMHSFIIYIFIALGIIFIINILYSCYSLIGAKIAPLITNKISEDLYDYVYKQSVNYYTNTMPGKISNQIGLVAGGLRSLYVSIFGAMIAIFISVIVNFALVLTMNIWVAMVLIGGTLFRILWALYRKKPISKASKEKSKMNSSTNGKLLDSLSNFMIIKLFSGANKEKKIMASVRSENIKKDQTSSREQQVFWLLPSFVEDCSTILILFLLGFLFATKKIQMSEAIFAITAYTVISDRIWDFVYNLPSMLDNYSTSSEAYEALVKPIDIQDIPNAPDLAVSRGVIELRNVSFKYKRNQTNPEEKEEDKKSEKKSARRVGSKPVLENFSLTIKPGEKVGVVGSSGAGKTTLVNLLMRFYDPTKGEILIDGQDIKGVTQDSLRQNIAFIPQEPTMFNRTLKENIGYGKSDATNAEIKKAAKQAQADKFIMDTEKKYDSVVGDRGIKLSGGQRQRVAIARAFLKDAPILILDEATSALDSETEAAIQKSFVKLSEGRTTIAIAHRLSTLRYMDRIVVMDKGKIAEQGTHAQLLKKKGGIYAKLWKMQSGGFLGE